MNDYDKGWISALTDSEGSLYWERYKRGYEHAYPVISITNTNFLLLLKAQKLIGGTIFIAPRDKPNHHICWHLVVRFKDWKNWLHEIPLIQKEVRRQEFLLWSLQQ